MKRQKKQNSPDNGVFAFSYWRGDLIHEKLDTTDEEGLPNFISYPSQKYLKVYTNREDCLEIAFYKRLSGWGVEVIDESTNRPIPIDNTIRLAVLHFVRIALRADRNPKLVGKGHVPRGRLHIFTNLSMGKFNTYQTFIRMLMKELRKRNGVDSCKDPDIAISGKQAAALMKFLSGLTYTGPIEQSFGGTR